MTKQKVRAILNDWVPGESIEGDGLMNGLEILKKYASGNVVSCVGHAIIFATRLEDAARAGITENEVIKLRRLGWESGLSLFKFKLPQ